MDGQENLVKFRCNFCSANSEFIWLDEFATHEGFRVFQCLKCQAIGTKNLAESTNTQEPVLNATPVATGVLLCRAAQLSTDGFKVPPPPKYFKNCSGSKNIVMTAGQMTTYRVNHSTSVKGWNAFLLNLSYHSTSINSTTGSTRHTHLGKMSLIALEKMMRTASTESVSLFYEASQFIASFITEKSKSYIITDFESTESNSAA